MRFGNRGPRSSAAGRREAFRPRFQRLEDRTLLAIDLGGQLPPANPNIATVPYGVVFGGLNSPGGAGFSVTDVGNVNGSGYDSYVVGAPTVINSNGRINPTSGSGTPSTAYLIFGSQSVTTAATAVQIVNWLTLGNGNPRVGDLSQLGNTPSGQQNPINGAVNTAFDGIKFVTTSTPGSQLGVSVSAVGDINGDGLDDFIIGAPGEPDFNNTPGSGGTGRAYLIYGSRSFDNVPSKTIDLDNQGSATRVGINIVTFANSATSSQTGRAVAGVGDVITDGIPDIAIGAPSASINGAVSTGAVYLVSGAALRGGVTQTILLQNVGQGAVPGAIITGVASGDQAGFAIAGAGDVDGAITTANQRIDDLLIGAPSANGTAGAAYLLYGAVNFPSLATVSNGVRTIALSRVGATGSTGVPGLTINGNTAGDETGFAVAPAGDFNGDGRDDLLIGSPGVNGNQGQALLLYGQPVTGTRLSGVVNISTYGKASNSVVFNGAAANALAGYSLAVVGRMSTNGTTLTTLPAIAIGSPGFNSMAGAVYVIPGAGALAGTFSLASAESQPVAATLVTITNTPTTPAFLGASVSGRVPFLLAPSNLTADGDPIADLIIGASGYGITSTRVLAGGVFILEGHFFPLQTPVSTAITTQIGVGAPFSAPFTVNATTPAALQIFVFSNATITPPFRPFTDIDPTTVVVNGVAFPNATITQDPVDENNDGIPDAIITITPRSNLGLTASTTTLTISGRTLATSPNAGKTWSGSAAIIVTGAPTPTPTPIPSAPVLAVGTVIPTSFVPPFGPEHFVPPESVLSRLDYKAIPLHVALNQYLPTPGFGVRTFDYFHPGATHPRNGAATGFAFQKHKIKTTLPNSLFTSSKFPTGKTVTFTHKVRVIPTNRQHEVYRPTPLKHPTNQF